MKLKVLTFFALLFTLCHLPAIQAQVKGKAVDLSPGIMNVPDSLIVFTSAKPLLADSLDDRIYKRIWGFNILFSGNGFGAGFFYQRLYTPTISGFIDLGISGARNTDELEYLDPYTGRPFVPGKVNRLYMFPLMAGIQYRLFAGTLSESLRPFVNIGAGPALIMAAPYPEAFFGSVSSATLYGRFGGFAGIGAAIGAMNRTSLSVNLRYYYIPFGGNGLESIKDLPITDFGGLFLTLSVGFAG
jgi:hypothetical protein